MAYVIGAACIEELVGSCVDACPVDCIYEGERRRYINPTECIECGACLPACPVHAITNGQNAQPEWAADNEQFFLGVLPGHSEPLGASPGGASLLGKIGTDTELTSKTTAPQTNTD
jgi:NAD-dependent dihydropyrimidine dehydrogenase PreA subunit